MTDPDLFNQGLLFFNSGKYFEAHEAWEDLWRVSTEPAKDFYQGLIQAAVGLYHLERGNRVGARAQLAKSVRHLSSHLSELPGDRHSIDIADLIRQLQEIHDQMQPQTVRIAPQK